MAAEDSFNHKAATAEDVSDDEVEEVKPLAKTAANQAAEASKVTDFAEEKETKLDEAQLKEIVSTIGQSTATEVAAKAEREKELAAVKISKADVKLIIEEIEVDEDAAELALREAGGDVVAALRTLTN